MEKKDRDLEAGVATSGQGGISRAQSPTGSISTDVDLDKVTSSDSHIRSSHDEKGFDELQTSSDKYGPDEINHGEPDLEYEDAEDAVPGRELDRRLSRVGSPSSEIQSEGCGRQT